MKVVLVAPPTPNPSPNYFGPPMGLALLGALLRREGHEPRGYDWDRSTVDAMLADVPRMLAEDRPDLFGISCLSITRGPSFALARRVRELAPDLPIVFGGPYATLEPEEILERTPADYVCIGDGEETLPELVRTLVAGGDPGKVAGLALREAGAVRRTTPRPEVVDLDALPYPDLDMFGVAEQLRAYARPDLAALDEGLSSKGRAPFVLQAALMVLGSRGCVWRCDFCPMSKFKGRTRMHSAEYVVDYVEHLVKTYGHRHIIFGDNTLTWWRPYAVELFTRMIERKLHVEWICMTRADRVDPELLALMRAAGCREISFGIESGSEIVHQTMKKKLKLRTVIDAFRWTHEAGILSTCMMMIGNRGDSREALRDTCGLVREVDPDRILIWKTRVYPGTVLHDVAVQQGVISPAYYDDENAPAPYYTGEHTLEDLEQLERELRHRTMWLDVGSDTGLETIDRGLRLSRWRAEGGTVLGGGEPLARPDLWEILARARRYDTKSVRLYTNGAAMARRSFAERAHKANAIRGLLVPLWSTSEAHHDARVGATGALRETRKGLLRWTEAGASALGLAMLDRFNVGTLPAWLRWMKDHRIGEAVVVYGVAPGGWDRVPPADLPRLAEVHDALQAAHAEAQRLGIDLEVAGAPRCVVPRELRIFEEGRPFDEAVLPGGEPYNVAERRRTAQKIFAAGCGECVVRHRCEGLWSDIAGHADPIRPIVADRAPEKAHRLPVLAAR